ncbi:MAG: serine hydrolase [Saprospiraceae bacterium]|nr:serine hydrolase [Saprospiraceae bacterium]
MKNLLSFLLCLATALSFAQKAPLTGYAKQLKEFDAYVEQARQAWKTPGLAVAVVKDGQVLFTKGYGVKQLGRPEPVDTETLFTCASTTKAMTAVCMGILVDEGKVKWDDPVINYLPGFQLYDPYATRELKVRDLFLHNSGVGNSDFLWAGMKVSSDEVLQKMRLVKPSYSLRSGFIYQNIFYLVAGEIIEKASGQPWEEFIRKRIFEPLKMSRTRPTRAAAASDPNQTSPHYLVNGNIQVIENTSADEIGPAGSVWSSIGDISKWVLCMLDSSKYEGGRLLQPATFREMFRPQTLVPASQFYPTQQLTKPNWTTYALGWFQHDYKGKKVNFHTGSLAGAIAIHGQMPEERIGVYVFGNFDHAEVRHALMYKAFDLFALGGNRDWSTEMLKLYDGLRERGEKAQKDMETKRVANTRPSLPLQAYTGTYTDPLYGEVQVSILDNQLVFNINQFVKATLPHWHYDTFYGPYEKAWYGNATARFMLKTTGEVEKLEFDGMEFEKNN